MRPAIGPPMMLAGIETAKQILEGRQQAWVDLRDDASQARHAQRALRRPVTAIAAALVLFLASMSGAMLWRAHGLR